MRVEWGAEVLVLTTRIAELTKALEYSVKQVPELGSVPGIAAALVDARDKALEEAAKVCDGINHQYTSSGGHASERCAKAIRSLQTNSEK